MIPAKMTITLNDIKDLPEFTEIMSNYPLYDESYRNTLNSKIINHFLYDEIGFETPHLFNHYLKIKLDEIMDKYNLLYKSKLLELDPLSNFSYIETLEKENSSNNTSKNVNTIEGSSTSQNTGQSSSQTTNTENSSGTQTGTENKENVLQKTPQGKIAHENLENFTYATEHTLDGNNTSTTTSRQNTTNVNDITSNTSSNSLSSTNTSTINAIDDINTTENYIKTIVGTKNITTTKILNEFINDFKSIDLMIIEELESLFMQVISL